jgi:hypothetical protein
MSTHRPVAAMLGRTILFKSLAERDRHLVARQMVAATFAPEQLIFARGDPPDDIYLVLKGRVRLSVFSLDGRMLSFKHAEPGDTFGEIGPLDGGARTADATALTQVEVMSLERAKLNALLEGNPRVARPPSSFYAPGCVKPASWPKASHCTRSRCGSPASCCRRSSASTAMGPRSTPSSSSASPRASSPC